MIKEIFDTALFILKEGYIVLAIVLWVVYKFSTKYSASADDLLNNLAWIMIVICIWVIVEWVLDFSDYYSELVESEYEQYALSKRFFGQYGLVYWTPIILVLGVLILNLFNRYRTKLLVLLLGIVLCFGSYYYPFFIPIKGEFISATWQYNFPPWYKMVLAFILNAAICLLLISIPKIYKLLRKQ